jgi:hypothetical protein
VNYGSLDEKGKTRKDQREKEFGSLAKIHILLILLKNV